MEVVGKLVKSITYTDRSFTIGKLPPKGVITSVMVTITTAFNDSGNDYLDVGVTTTGAEVVSNHSLATKGSTAATIATTANDGYSAVATQTIYGIYQPATSDPSAGAAVITVEWAQL